MAHCCHLAVQILTILDSIFLSWILDRGTEFPSVFCVVGTSRGEVFTMVGLADRSNDRVLVDL